MCLGDFCLGFILFGTLWVQKYIVGTSATANEFTTEGAEITVPTGVTGKIYVEYEYEATSAVKVSNNTEKFPEAVGVKIFAIFKDQCNENIKYAGSVIAKKGKIDASSVDTTLTSTGKHPFAIDFIKDYCDEESNLFDVIVAE